MAVIAWSGGIGRAFSRQLAASERASSSSVRRSAIRICQASKFMKADLSLMREAKRIGGELPACDTRHRCLHDRHHGEDPSAR